MNIEELAVVIKRTLAKEYPDAPLSWNDEKSSDDAEEDDDIFLSSPREVVEAFQDESYEFDAVAHLRLVLDSYRDYIDENLIADILLDEIAEDLEAFTAWKREFLAPLADAGISYAQCIEFLHETGQVDFDTLRGESGESRLRGFYNAGKSPSDTVDGFLEAYGHFDDDEYWNCPASVGRQRARKHKRED